MADVARVAGAFHGRLVGLAGRSSSHLKRAEAPGECVRLI
jgi:hypothetical protein